MGILDKISQKLGNRIGKYAIRYESRSRKSDF